jgi:hypothetical protein
MLSAVLHEVKERALVDKPITEAEVVALLEASHWRDGLQPRPLREVIRMR